MVLARIDDRPTFEVVVFRGYAVYVLESLAESASEFGFTIVA
jgi:sarcosine oxidase gamma subunit